jgi:hypothetical protein
VATPTHVQNSGIQEGVGVTSISYTLTGVQAGNMLATVHTVQTANRDFTTTSDNGNSWIERLDQFSPELAIFDSIGANAGNTQITHTVNVSTANLKAVGYEVANVVAFDTSDFYDDTTIENTHELSQAGINTAADVIVFGVGRLGATGGAMTPPTGWITYNPVYTNSAWIGYRISAAPLTSYVGTWTHVATARAARGLITSYKGASAPTFPYPVIRKLKPKFNTLLRM